MACTTLEGQGLSAARRGPRQPRRPLRGRRARRGRAASSTRPPGSTTCARRADRSDAIAPYNYANIRLAQGAHDEAALAYQRALARDPRFIEARYNLAQALEAAGKIDAAEAELDRVLAADPSYADAVFNLAQLRMKAGEMAEAKALYERYLALDPPDDWAATARKAIAYCAASLASP